MSIAFHPTETPAEGASRLLIWLGLAILMVALPSLSVAFSGAIYVLMPIGAVIVLIGAVIGAPDHGPRHLREALASPAGTAALFVSFWAGLSLLWTPFPAEAAQRFTQIVGTTFLVALVAAWLPTRMRTADLYLLPIGVALSALALIVLAAGWRAPLSGAQAAGDSRLARAMISLIVLVWPALGALCLREHWILAAGLALLTAGVALAGFAQAALAAMGAAAFVFAMAMGNPARIAHFLGLAAAGLILTAPITPLLFGALFGVGAGEPSVAAHAMLIWRDLIISEWPRLITGHGFDAANRTLALGFLPELAPKGLLFVIWYDLGVIGAAAFAYLTAQIFMLAARIPAAVAPAALAGLVAMLALAMLGAAVAQIWWITLIDCAVIAYIVLVKGLYRSQRPPAPHRNEEKEFDGGEAAEFESSDLESLDRAPARGA